jgi:O-antigen/teichoic acid export membrane protein
MAEGKGIYSIFQSDIDLLTLFLGFTISSAIVFYISNSKIALEKLIGIGITVILIGVVLLSFILIILNLSFSHNFLFPKGYNTLYHYFYLITAFALVISISIISSIFQGKSLFRVVNFLTIFNSCINFLVFGTLFYLSIFKHYPISINQVLLISILIYILNILLWAYFYKKYINIRPKFNFEYTSEIKPLFIFMTIGHIAHIVNFLTYKMDYWIVEHYNGAKELGYYSQAVGFAQMFWAITNPIIIVLTPYLTSKDSKESLESFKFYSRVNFTIIIILVAIAVLIAGIIFPIYGSEFSNSVLPFRILSIGIIMSCITKIFAVYIYSQNKIIYNLIASIIAFFITLALDFILIPVYGSIGASIATAISYTALTIAVSYFLFVKLKVDFKNMFILTKADIATIKTRIPIAIFKK